MSDSEEEILVYASFEDGVVDSEVLKDPKVTLKVIGLDTETPILQLGDGTFKGSWQDTVGTKVLFEIDPSPQQVDPAFTVQPAKMYKYKCKTTKSLELSRFFLKSRSANMENKGEKDSELLTSSQTSEDGQDSVNMD